MSVSSFMGFLKGKSSIMIYEKWGEKIKYKYKNRQFWCRGYYVDTVGKTIMPFCTSGGSGISTSVSAIKEACPNADVKDGFRGTSSTASEQIEEWFSNSGI